MSLSCRNQHGEVMTFESFDGKLLVFESPRAFAPGNPLKVRVETPSLTLELKSIGSRKRAEGVFEVRARVMTMPKEVRDALNGHFGIES